MLWLTVHWLRVCGGAVLKPAKRKHHIARTTSLRAQGPVSLIASRLDIKTLRMGVQVCRAWRVSATKCTLLNLAESTMHVGMLYGDKGG